MNNTETTLPCGCLGCRGSRTLTRTSQSWMWETPLSLRAGAQVRPPDQHHMTRATSCVNKQPHFFLNTVVCTGATVTDFDGDGLLDLLVAHGESASQPISVYKVNQVCQKAHSQCKNLSI